MTLAATNGEIIHVYPTGGPEHCLDGPGCWCEPEHEPVEREDGQMGLILIHREIH